MKKWVKIILYILISILILLSLFYFFYITKITHGGGEHDKCPYDPSYSDFKNCRNLTYCPAGVFYYDRNSDSCYEWSGGECCYAGANIGFETKGRCDKVCKGLNKYMPK